MDVFSDLGGNMFIFGSFYFTNKIGNSIDHVNDFLVWMKTLDGKDMRVEV